MRSIGQHACGLCGRVVGALASHFCFDVPYIRLMQGFLDKENHKRGNRAKFFLYTKEITTGGTKGIFLCTKENHHKED